MGLIGKIYSYIINMWKILDPIYFRRISTRIISKFRMIATLEKITYIRVKYQVAATTKAEKINGP